MVNGLDLTTDASGPDSYNTIKAQSAITTSGIKVILPARGAIFMAVDKK